MTQGSAGRNLGLNDGTPLAFIATVCGKDVVYGNKCLHRDNPSNIFSAAFSSFQNSASNSFAGVGGKRAALD